MLHPLPDASACAIQGARPSDAHAQWERKGSPPCTSSPTFFSSVQTQKKEVVGLEEKGGSLLCEPE